MGSVWKRIQRVGKRASKFQFIASYQTLTLECSRDGKWQPNKLNVIWSRRSKRKAVKSKTWQPSIANPFRGMIVWTDPEEIEITVTLYKDARDGSPFEDKLWTFVIEDEAVSGKRRPVASVSLNMVDYHSIDLQTFCLNLPLRPATKKVISASLELNLGCVLLKEGNAMDEDMISMSSLMSLSDPYGSRDFEDSGKNFKRNTHKRLSLRSGKSKNKPTFNLASPNTGSPKQKKTSKHRGKTPTNEMLNSSCPTEAPDGSLNKPLSTSYTDLSKIGNRASPMITKKQESKSAAEEELLKWCQECVKDYENVTVTNMTTSWRNGLAFCAIINHFNPDMLEYSKLKPDDIRENNRLAFEAFDYLGISRMLDPHQMVLASVPDKLLIMTYLHQIKQHFTTKPHDEEEELSELTLAAITEVSKKLTQISENTIADFTRNHTTTESSTAELQNDKTREIKLNPSENKLQIEKRNEIELDPSKNNTQNEKRMNEIESKTLKTKLQNEKPKDIKLDLSKTNSHNENAKAESKSNSSKPNLQNERTNEIALNSSKTNLQNERTNKIELNPSKMKLQNERTNKPPSKANELQYVAKPGNNPFDEEPKETFGSNKLDVGKLDVLNTRTTEAPSVEKIVTEHKDICDSEGKGYTAIKPRNLDLSGAKAAEKSIVYSPKPGYNPFLDDVGFDVEEKGSKREEPLNPFDDDYDEKLLQQSGEIEQSGEIDKQTDELRSESAQSQEPNKQPERGTPERLNMSKSLNPFDDDYEESSESTFVEDKRENDKPVSMAKTTASSARTISLKNGNGHVSRIPRRPAERPSTLPNQPAIKKPLARTRPLTKPEPIDIVLRRSSIPGSPRGPELSPGTGPTSPRKVIPSFEEWKAQKSDDVAKQEKRKAQARLMIKEARAKNTKSQIPSKNETSKQLLAPTSSLPRPASSPKKYRAPEPPSQANLASKLKNEIEYQKKITEKTRKTLESSRIKRINPKQENVPVVEVRNERSEKVQQAINDAKENPNRKPKTSDASKPQNEPETKLSSGMTSPPKPPRVYIYTDDMTTQDGEDETDSGLVESVKSSEEEEVDNGGSSLQQNPFKLTIKRKEAPPQAVVKPQPSTTTTPSGIKETKIDLKKYSVKSRKLSAARVDELSDGKRKHRKGERTENNYIAEKVKHTGRVSKSQDSLSDGQQSSEEDVNDILDNIGNLSENENKTDEESLHYDNAGEEEDFQDTSQYVEHEIATLEEDRIALDRVAVKLEKELRDAMNTADCKEEEQRLFQEWFLLVNKRNEIVRRQTELSILEKEEDLEKRFELLNRELRFLMSDNSDDKTAQEQKREELLLSELVLLVNKRDELVRIEDSQVQEAEKAAKHCEHIVRNTRIPKKQSECSLQ